MAFLNEYIDHLSESGQKEAAVFYWAKKNNRSTLTYAAVKEIRDNIHKELLQNNVETCSCIGLIMDHNVFIPSIILSLQNYGVAFVFLDVNDYWKVNECLIAKLGIKWVLSEAKLQDIKLKAESTIQYCDKEILILWKMDVNPNTNYFNICYVMCSSGTTGEPKIVKVQHNCILANIKSFRDLFQLTDQDLIFCNTPSTFDPFIIELFLSFVTGAKLLFVSPILKLNTAYLMDLVLFPKDKKPYQGVTFLQTVPSLFVRFHSYFEFILNKSTLKILAFGGEPFPMDLPPWDGPLRVFNLYGITEVSCWASVHEAVRGEHEITLGSALDETILEVRRDEKAVLNGIGELFIGSNSRVCLLNDESEHTLSKPVFRSTGDLVEIKANKIIYKCRSNRLVKRFGHKIDLNAIERIIGAIVDLKTRCIYIDNRLILFLRVNEFNSERKERIIDKIRVQLLHSIPKECQPDFIEITPEFPLTKHGKIDDRTLITIWKELQQYDERDKESATVLQNLLCKYLGFNVKNYNVYKTYTYFELGGSSFTLIQLVNEFQRITNWDPVHELSNKLLEKSCEDCLEFVKRNPVGVKRQNEDSSSKKNINFINIHNNIKLKVKWKYNLEGCVDSAPAILQKKDEFYVAVGAFSHNFVLLNVQTADEVFKLVLPDAIERPCLFSDNRIFIGCYDGKMYSVNETGVILWEFKTGDNIKCTPCLCLDDSAIAFGSYDQYIYCLKVTNGELIWKTNLSEKIRSDVVASGDSLFVVTISGTFFRVLEASGLVAWMHRFRTPMFTSPCIFDSLESIILTDVTGCVYYCNPNLIAAKGKGDEKCFQFEGNIYSTPKPYKNNILFGSGDAFCVLNIEDSSESRLNVRLDSAISTTPSVINLKEKDYAVVITSKGNLYLIDLLSGTIEGHIRLPSDSFSSPVVSNGNIFVGCRDNNLYSIEVVQ